MTIVRGAAERSARVALARRVAPLVLCLAAIAGCDGDDGDDDVAVIGGAGDSLGGSTTAGEPPIDDAPSDPNARPGLVVRGLDGRAAEDVRVRWFVNTRLFRNDSVPDASDMSVGLVEYEGQQVSSFLDFYAKEIDTCELRREDTGDGGGSGGGGPPPRVSGGATVTIGSPAGPWLVLDRVPSEDGSEVDYRGDLPGPLPAGATLSIPGDVFPSVAAYPLTEPTVPVSLLPAEGDPIDARGVFSWVPGGGEEFVELVFAAFDPAGGFIDFPLVCVVADDGRFTMPPDAAAFIESTGDELVLHHERIREVVELSGGIVFRTRATVRE